MSAFGIPAPRLPSLQAPTRRSLRRQFHHRCAQPGTLPVGRRDSGAGPEGLLVRSDQVESRYAWSGITAIVETPAQLFLMAGGTNAHPIPRRDVPEAALRAFRDAVAARTGLPITPARG